MSYSPYAHTTATTAHVGLLKLGTGVNADASGGLVTTSVPNGVTTGGSYSDPSWITSLASSKVGLGTSANPQFNSLNVGGAYGTVAGVAYLGGANTYVSGNNTTMFVAGSTINFYSSGATQASVTYNGLQATSLGVGTTPSGTSGSINASSINFGGSTLSTYTDWTSWTPSFSSGLGSGGITKSFYSRIGNVVHFYVTLTSNSNNSGSFALPFTSVDWATGKWVFRTTANTYPQAQGSWIVSGAACFFDQLAASSLAAGDLFIFSGTFRV